MYRTSYLQAEGMATETLIHGPLLCASAEDLFVLVAPGGAMRERTLELARLVEEIEAPCLIGGNGTDGAPEGARPLDVPSVPEPFSALVCLLRYSSLPTSWRSPAGRTPTRSACKIHASRG